MTTVDVDLWVAAVRDNAAQFSGAARKAGLEAPVATVPKWSVSELVVHMGSVHRWVQELLATQAQERPGWPAAPETDDLLAWFDEGAALLVDTLGGSDLSASVWTFSPAGNRPGRWWARRMAHEMIIHRVDAESAAGAVSRVEPPELAVDGIDEMFEIIPVRHARNDDMKALEGTYHFHATDVPGEWVVDFAGGAVAVRREHAKCPVAVRGPASALELFIYNRGPADEVEILGDASLMEQWTAAVRF